MSIWKLQFNCRVCNRCLCKRSPAVDGKLDIHLCTINLIVIFQARMTTNGTEKSSVLCVFVFALLCEWVCAVKTLLSWWYFNCEYETFFFLNLCIVPTDSCMKQNKRSGGNNWEPAGLLGVMLLFSKWPVWMNCHRCTKMCMFEQRIVINTAMLSCSGRAAISQLWWLNTGGKGSSEGRLEQYFTHLDLLNATAVAPSESVRQHHFPKNSCYLSDFLIRVDSWLHCAGFGGGSEVPRYGSL